MFEISEKLILEQSDEIFEVSQISWKNSPWKQLSLVNDEEVISLSHAKTWFKSSSRYSALDTIDGEPMEFEWNIFPGFTTLQLCHKVQELQLRLSVTLEKFTGRIIFMSMFNDISWDLKKMNGNAN